MPFERILVLKKKQKQKKGILLPFKGPPKQPKKCKGCVWGRWDGVKQFCLKPSKCIKEEKPS
ncbi:hypothetical protein QD47_25045 [Paenibacillus terrae]|uniref:Uncharacterized protein n=1 Tax=Paenibacillus terrae TaxID=159743 RepID=A0A0D7WWB9_9BACL|nr:hypothetical protein QD47_25045 [Paenibacillus terrae]